jgi:hypothetical protein
MSLSVSPSTPFASIDWTTFENRPEINSSMPFCTEKNWVQNYKCCMDGYSIEHAIEGTLGRSKRKPGTRFLEQYPCVNGPELESLVEGIPRPGNDPTDIPSEPTPQPTTPATDDNGACDNRAVKAFLKFVKSVGFDDTVEVSRLKQGFKISCEALIDMAVRYGRASQ